MKGKLEQQRQARAIILENKSDAGHVYLSADGVSINATLSSTEGGKHFKIDASFNDPAKVKAFASSLKGGADLKVTSRFRYYKTLAQLAELKSIFLLLTAKFGYTFAFSKEGYFVRELIRNASANIVPLSYFHPSEGSDLPGIIFEKTSKVFYINFSGRYISIAWDIDKMKNFQGIAKTGERVTITGAQFPFPTSFEAALDHNSHRDIND